MLIQWLHVGMQETTANVGQPPHGTFLSHLCLACCHDSSFKISARQQLGGAVFAQCHC